MTGQLPLPDAQNKLEDLSGIVLKPGENPYMALIKACDDKPVSEAPNTSRSMYLLT